jgi:hypothetical protein
VRRAFPLAVLPVAPQVFVLAEPVVAALALPVEASLVSAQVALLEPVSPPVFRLLDSVAALALASRVVESASLPAFQLPYLVAAQEPVSPEAVLAQLSLPVAQLLCSVAPESEPESPASAQAAQALVAVLPPVHQDEPLADQAARAAEHSVVPQQVYWVAQVALPVRQVEPLADQADSVAHFAAR